MSGINKDEGDPSGRAEELRRYAILHTRPDPAFDELVQLAAQLCETPIALVSFPDRDRYWFKARWGVDVHDTAEDPAGLFDPQGNAECVSIDDARSDRRFAGHPWLIGDTEIQFAMAAPLRSPSGTLLGTLCVLDRVPRRLSASQHCGLLVLARQGASLMELQRISREHGDCETRFASMLDRVHRQHVIDLERLRTQATLFEKIQSAAHMGAWELVLDTETLRWTEETYRIHGLTPQEFVPTVEDAINLYIPADRPKIRIAVDKAIAAASSYDLELQIEIGASQSRWIRTTGHAEQAAQVPHRLYGTFQDITERRALERAVLLAGQDERERLGYALHDGLGQELAGTALLLQSVMVRARTVDPSIAKDINEAIGLVNHSLETCRALAQDVAPTHPTQGGLEAALRSLCVRIEKLSSISVTAECRMSRTAPFDTIISDQLYLIAQEALMNAVKHSGAHAVELKLAVRADCARLSVTDDGKGIGLEPGSGMGILIMQHRARLIGAQIDIIRLPKGGTSVRCVLERTARPPPTES